MAIWKDAEGNLHDDMDGSALALASWPQGLTEITDAEAQAIRDSMPQNQPTIQQQINALKPTDTCIMAAICGDEAAKASVQSAYQQIEALKAQL